MGFLYKKFRTKTKRKWPKSPYQRAKDLLDDVFSILIRTRDRRRYGGVCPICKSRPIEVCFHFFPRGNLATRFEPDASCGSCSPCNMGEMLNRNRTDKYKNALIGMVGQERYDELERQSRSKVKMSAEDLLTSKRAIEAKMAKGDF